MAKNSVSAAGPKADSSLALGQGREVDLSAELHEGYDPNAEPGRPGLLLPTDFFKRPDADGALPTQPNFISGPVLAVSRGISEAWQSFKGMFGGSNDAGSGLSRSGDSFGNNDAVRRGSNGLAEDLTAPVSRIGGGGGLAAVSFAGGANSVAAAIFSPEDSDTTRRTATPGAPLTAPEVAMNDVSTSEGQRVPFTVALTADSKPGVETWLVIGGLPLGASLSAGTDNGDGTWTVSLADLPGLDVILPPYTSGHFMLGITAVSKEGGEILSTQIYTPLDIAGVATAPNLAAPAANGLEDAPVALSITSSLVDTDGSETLSLLIGGLPTGAVLSAGTNNGNGTWTLTSAQLAGLTLIPAADYHGNFNLTVSAISSEEGTTATTTMLLAVSIGAVADAPTLSVSAASGGEDSAIGLTISSAVAEAGETLTLTITGVPAGAVLSAGVNQGGGVWTLSSAQMANLTLTPPLNYSGAFNLGVTATSSENGTSASRSATLGVTVTGVADAPNLSVTAASGSEDTAISLPIAASLVDNDGSETLSISISGVPVGAVLSAGTNLGGGVWSLTPAQLAGLTLTPPPNYNGSFNITVSAISGEDGTTATSSTTLSVTVAPVADVPSLTVVPVSGNEDSAISLSIATAAVGGEALSVEISGVPLGATLSAGTNLGGGVWSVTPGQLAGLSLTPPNNYSGNFTLGVTVTATEGSSTAQRSASFAVSVAGVPDMPTLSVVAASGLEDSPVALNISSALTDTDGSETLGVTVSGVPTGAVLSAGTNLGGGVWTLTSAQLAGLTITPPSGFSGGFSLSVVATASENGQSVSTAPTSMGVTVAGVADAPTLATSPASGNEDTAIALTISAALTDTDGSETLSVTIGNVPVGAVLSAGTNNGNGTWTLTPGQLSGLTFTPPPHASGNFSLTVTATSSEGATHADTSANLAITVAGVATTPSLSVSAASGNEDTNIPLTINATLVDNDGSEVLSVIIGGIPAGAHLSAGTDNGNGTWTLTPAQVAGLTFMPPLHASGSYPLTVTAVSSEGATSAQTATNLSVSVIGVATPPNLTTHNASGDEDTVIPLNLSASLADTDGSETLTLVIGGVPAGAVLSAGVDNGNGTWTIPPGSLPGLTFTPPSHTSGQFQLTVTATSHEGASSANTSGSVFVAVGAVASPPDVTTQIATGNEDTAIALNITADLTDTDGSETMTLTIYGVPNGAVLSAGIFQGGGSWALTPADLAGLTITPPLNYSGTFNLTVTATSEEAGTRADTVASLPVIVAGVADAPTLSVNNASGNEGAAIALNISAALTDTDGSETLNVVITGVPSGAVLSAGVNNGGGSWTVPGGQLSGLTLTPPLHYSGTLNLGVTAISSESGTSASTGPSSMSVAVAGVADAPTLIVQNASGLEDAAIPLNITSALVDTDGSETLSINISGVPVGATLSAGTNQGGGVWSLTPGQLAGLTITTASGYDGNFNLTVTATSTEGATHADTVGVLGVTVAGVADAPNLSVAAASGIEDTAIALTISAAAVDSDEALSITITGVPTGGVLSAGTNNGGGSWTLTSAQLSGLTFTPPPNASGSYSFTVTATSSEDGTTASTSSNLAVTVAGVADAPSLSVAPASGNEDTAIALSITTALTDTDGSESLSINISGVPVGATLSAGINNGGGSWTLTPAQLSGLKITPPANYSGSFNLTVTSTSSENGTHADTAATLAVSVAGIADAPTLSVAPASGNEDTAIALAISPALVDADGSEVLSITITGVPTGAALSAGTNNGGGSWTLTPGQLSNLKITPPANWSGSFNLGVAATSSENGTTATTSATLTVTVAGVADAPSLSVSPASGDEDTAISLTISAGLVDTDGSESLAIQISGVPVGAVLSAGTNAGGGVWNLTAGQLTNLKITPPHDYSGTINLTVTATSSENGTTASSSAGLAVTVAGVADAPTLSTSPASGNEDTAIALTINSAVTDASETLSVLVTGVPSGAVLSAGTNNGNGTWTLTSAQLSGLTITPPANYSGSFTLGVTATSSENGTSVGVSGSLAVTVAGVADAPTLSVTPASGNEDSAIALSITPALVDTDGSETLSVTISGVPTGAVLSAGTNLGGGVWRLTPAQLSSLTITPPHDYSGSFNLTVTATASENGTTASTATTLAVSVAGVADAPTLSVAAASGNEDSAIALTINAALTDSSETLSVLIGNVPAGATLSAGTDNGNGTWTLTAAQLTGLSITPPHDYSGTINLSVTATSSENGTSASTGPATLGVTVAGVADAPTLSVAAASGNEDSAIGLSISAALTDASETLSVLIGNVPAGAVLSAGTNNGNGTWTLTPAQLSGLTITPPANYSGTINLAVSATSSENGTSATTGPSTLGVTVAGVADTPTLIVQAASGAEGTQIPLTINAALTDTDGSETLTVTLTGVPTGATLSAGVNNGGGSWTLTAAQLANLKITPPLHYSGSFNLGITATASENGTTASTGPSSMTVNVSGVADAPSLTVHAASGNEDTAIALSISPALVDTDGSETLSVQISGVPTGAVLSAGTNLGGGVWSLTPAQVVGLTITPPTNYSGSFNLTVAATSSENGTTATTSATLGVSIAGVADTPSLSVAAASGNEDTQISLSITSSLVDADGSESLAIQITGVPTGATLSAGTNAGGGVWNLTPAQLTNLKITPPSNYSGSFNLTVTATSSENGTTAQTQSTLGVTVAGVADAPTLSVSAASGNEDSQIPLTITTALTDTDGSESVAIVITGVPAGATLSAGINSGGGSWTLTSGQLAGLKITPPVNYSGSFNLTVTSTSSENGTTASTQATLGVTVAGVADTPTLSVSAASGNEDTQIALSITTALTDTDGSETLGIQISGVPTGATLSAGTNAGGGVWNLTAAQLTNLKITPPSNYSGSFNLTVTSTASENSTTASISTTLGVTVAGVADAPTLSVSPASGNEDTAIALTIASALTDTDGSESLAIQITGVPTGATLSAGTNAGGGVWNLTAAQLTNLKITPPSNSNVDFTLTVKATASENGTTATTTTTLPVTVKGVADTPALSVSAASGNEDTAISLSITPALTDVDGSETLSIVISNVPTGAILSAGTYAGGGKWTLNPAQLVGLTITPPAQYSGAMALTVAAVSTENDSSYASTSTTLNVTVNPVADTPNLVVATARGNEDTAISLSISGSLVDSSESLSYQITGVPTGATLTAGTNAGGGVWNLTSAQLSSLKINPPTNSDADFNLTVKAISTESDGTTSIRTATLPVIVNAVGDAPNVTAANVSNVSTGGQVSLNITAASLVDTDGSESALTYVIHGMPDGFALNQGVNNGDNTWTVTAAQLSGLKLVPPLQFNGQLTLNVTSVAHESDGSAVMGNPTAFTARVGDWSNGYLIALDVGLNVGAIGVGVQVGVIPSTIDLLPASGGLLSTGGIYVKEEGSYTITDAPNLLGSPLLSGLLGLVATIQLKITPSTAATFTTGTNKGGGVWEFTAAQWSSVTLQVANNNSDADFTILGSVKLLTAIVIDIQSAVVHVMGVADTPTITSSSAATGTEDGTFSLTIAGALTDTDGSESSSWLLSNVPTGFKLNHGVNNGNGTWSLTDADLTGLTVTPTANYSGSGSFTLSHVATESDGDQKVVQQTVNYSVTAVADAPTVTPLAHTGTEDTALSLNFGAAVVDTDGSESISSLTISGLPTGASLTNATNNGDGTWTVTSANINSVQLVPGANWSGDATLSVTAISRESSNGVTASTTGSLSVHINPVADAPTLSVSNVSDTSSAPIHLSISAGLTDSSETLSVVVSSVPTGALLSAGVNNGDGSWTLTPAQLSALSISPPEGFHGDMNLTATAYSFESDGTSASTSHAFTVHVDYDHLYQT